MHKLYAMVKPTIIFGIYDQNELLMSFILTNN